MGTTKNIAGLYDLESNYLSRGKFGTIFPAVHSITKEKVAVKIVDKSKLLDDIGKEALLKEVLCMTKVQHRGVVRLYQVIDTEKKLYLVEELGKGGDLWGVIDKWSNRRGKRGLEEEAAKHFFKQIFEAVSHCHSLHVVHRDLKPENVLYFPPPKTVTPTTSTPPTLSQKYGDVKLTDFGFSNSYTPGTLLQTSCGSLAYSSPEILLGDKYHPPSVDIWSLGVILYTMVVGAPPFQEANDSETLTKIMDVRYTIPPHVSENCADLIRKMLLRDPLKRITMEGIRSHEWVGLGSQGEPPQPPPHHKKEEPPQINPHIIHTLTLEAGLVESEILTSLKNNCYDYNSASYYLLSEKLAREQALNSVEKCKNVTQDDLSLVKEEKKLKEDQEVEKKEFVVEEKEEEEEVVTVTEEKKKKRSFFNWLFKSKTLNNNRIYKTRSCGELKLK